MSKHQVAIIGSGNIGTDLMMKVLRRSEVLEMAALVGIDPASDGLARARRLGITAIDDGIDGLLRMPGFEDIAVVFDATSARAHLHNWELLGPTGVQVVDLTPAAVGPLVVPPVNLEGLADARNVNMVTCGGQATIPMVAAVGQVAPVLYAEIVASISSRSAGPGTRANIDEFTETTSRAIVDVGGAARGKAVIVLNPAEPPMIMRDTVYCLTTGGDPAAIADSVSAMAERVRGYVRGYRVKQEVQHRPLSPDDPLLRLADATGRTDVSLVTIFLEVAGAGDYLPEYAGNLDIMTAAALRVGETLVRARLLEATA
ncbi:acetaldehyde dehydrogenase (acetylating) [Nocardioides endophyticus]|uniref:Acetaldehyde dehydrogenase n=1 Tax=Nocardioides endophyticus TaxID=1353775 RepID=A0ABP8YI83_9ACTN